MSKWYNKAKTLMIDLDKVSSFSTSEFDDVFLIELIIDGNPMEFYGADAIEIYNLLEKIKK